MKNILIITLVLAVLSAGLIGLLVLFGMMDTAAAGPILAKSIGGFAILGACAAAISALMPARRN
jgi:hypothetical protein